MPISEKRLKRYFWDADFGALDTEKHRRYIIERILELGDGPSVEWMRKTFKVPDILQVLRETKNISKKSLRFWELVLNR